MILDEYLKRDALYNYLIYKYKKHGRLIIACDFDRVLFDSKETGESYEMVRQLIRDLYKIGCFIIIWTGNKDIDFVELFLAENNIPYNTINADAPFIKSEHISRKIYANIFLDDRAGLIEVYVNLIKFLKKLKDDNELEKSRG